MSFSLVTLRISDMTESLNFYNGILGLPLIKQFENKDHEKIAMLGQDDQPHIELIETSLNGKPGIGVSIGFEVADPQEIIRQVSSTYDCSPVGPISPNPYLQFYFIKDPDGYQVQLLQRIAGV